MGRLSARLRDQRGIALILVLMVTTTLTVLILDLHQSVRINFHIATNLTDGIKASYLVRSGIQVAAGALLKDIQDNSTDSWSEDWFDFLGKAGMPGIPVARDQLIMMEINDESGRFNLNTMVDKDGRAVQERLDIFKRLLTNEDLDVQLANPIIDWIDADEEIQGGGGQEDQAYGYGTEENDALSKNSRFESIQEVRLVAGVTDEVWTKLEPIITTYGDKKMNLNTAPKKVIKAVLQNADENADVTIVDRIDDWRRNSADGEDGGSEGAGFTGGEGNVFQNKGLVKQLITEVGVERRLAFKLARQFSGSSHFFRVTVTALVSGVQKNAIGIIFRSKKKVRIIYYRVAPGISVEHAKQFAEQEGAMGEGAGGLGLLSEIGG